MLEHATSETDLDRMVRMFDGANLIVHGFDGVIQRWTSGCEQLYGWSAAEAVGNVVHDLLDTQFSADVEELRANVRDKGFWSGQVGHRRKDGVTLAIVSRWTVLDLGDPDTLIVQSNNDVTLMQQVEDELRERQAHLQSILDTVPDAMVVIDDRGIIASFSAAAEKLFGYSAHESIGRNVSMLMPSPDREAHDGYLDSYIRTGRRRIIGYGRVVVGLRKNGTTFPMELSVGEAVAGGKRIFTGFVRDLTSRHRIEAELRQSQKMEAVGQLTGGLAHDFNNLLAVISGNLEMLEARLAEPGQLSLLREAQSAADDGARLTSQLLAFGRRQALAPKELDVGALLGEFSDLVQRTLGDSVELRTIIPGRRLSAMADKAQLQSALLNLSINARDAMPAGGRLTIEISGVEIDADYVGMYPAIRPGRYVLISVTDTGTGMTPEVMERAFEPFFTTKPTGSGTGLGLSMVYGFAKQSAGHLQLYSEPGEGTTVRLFLPRADAGKDSHPDEQQARDAPSHGTETILVVEDDARVRRVTVSRLQTLGYSVIEATNGIDALKELGAGHDVALLFSDVAMPGMNGDELARKVRERWPRVKILLTSGFSEPHAAEKEILAGAGWLKKPYTASEMSTRLRLLLDEKYDGDSA
ncbi:PAS domain S-box protein [Rhizobium ruizarguesonis]|uniref:hybrid sensor histidine kinase/response regulator n=1 Tax=Rhizobium TaxID=379 RepID=UPI0010304436|nr:PAS domain-containing sensor histidine kinase [Rhizobium ruizarguesonis]NEH34914.1 PAS domain S-box protein [Rhizobium ruizarguesonis]NEI78738.1 PAS domain S-box protein [Rhizobium ruizarguesonis]TAW77262.1 PAS domain-containing sensor histidine kinase [Rhizobium ruizarguesonis]TAX14227.1 PAS domain-containing sensor histidine kinase [Rhizobium ruizarguesonis]TAX19059.1 PAS domain-containing sensor histidine kinase [Rhizobium ruizarguesonis]